MRNREKKEGFIYIFPSSSLSLSVTVSCLHSFIQFQLCNLALLPQVTSPLAWLYWAGLFVVDWRIGTIQVIRVFPATQTIKWKGKADLALLCWWQMKGLSCTPCRSYRGHCSPSKNFPLGLLVVGSFKLQYIEELPQCSSQGHIFLRQLPQWLRPGWGTRPSHVCPTWHCEQFLCGSPPLGWLTSSELLLCSSSLLSSKQTQPCIIVWRFPLPGPAPPPPRFYTH